MGQFGNVKEPSRRYAISYKGKAYFSAEIPDFVHDSNWASKLVEAGGTFSPRGGALDFWDAQHEEWVGIAQNAVPTLDPLTRDSALRLQGPGALEIGYRFSPRP